MAQYHCQARPALMVCMLLLIVSAAGAQAPLGQAWTVDASNGPGTDFTTITAAIAAAVPNDRIFVRAGLYVEDVVIDKGIKLIGWNATTYPLTVPADPYANAIKGTLLIHDVPNDQTCIVSGFPIVPNGTPGYSVGLINSRGPMVLDRLVIENGSLFIMNGEDVLLQDVRVRSPQGGASPLSGMTAYNSWIQGTDLDVTGGEVGPEPNFAPAGGPALEVFYPSVVSLARPRLAGGGGGGPWIVSGATPSGGPAIRVYGAIVSIIDDQTGLNFIAGGQGGSRGVGSAPAIPSGNGGNAIEINGGTVVNKKPMVLTPGSPGASLSGGPIGAGGQGAVVSAGNYMPIVDIPALFRVVGSTAAGGSLTITFQSASPSLICGLGACYDFDLALLYNSPSVQFSAGKPSAVEFLSVGMSNAASVFEVVVTLPNPLGAEAGRSGMVQGGDVVGNVAFLSNPSVIVLGF